MTKALFGKVAVDGSWIIRNRSEWRYVRFALSRETYPNVTGYSFAGLHQKRTELLDSAMRKIESRTAGPMTGEKMDIRAAQRGRPSGYTEEACNAIVALMEQGYSLAAAAGGMRVARSTLHNWMKQHPEFLEAVELGKSLRVYKLETDMLASENSAVVNARRFALVNAAPEEWREKQTVDVDVPTDSPIRLLARQLMGTAIRPQHPAGVIIDHDLAEMVTVTARVERENTVTIPVTIPVTTNDERDEDGDTLRLHTI